MENRIDNLKSILNDFREWNKTWENNKQGSVNSDEFIEELSKKYNISLNGSN